MLGERPDPIGKVGGSNPPISTKLYMPFTYILQSEPTGKFYIGSTMDLTSRIYDHNSGNTVSTKHFRPWKIIYSEEFTTLTEARRRERQIKGWKNPQFMIKQLKIEL
jgi:putative endonuclease